MKVKRFQYEDGFVDLSSNGFGGLRVTGVVNHVPVDFNYESAEAWYICFEPNSVNLAYDNAAEAQNRVRECIHGVALMVADEKRAQDNKNSSNSSQSNN